jgi:hypothetical protein
MRTEYLLLLPSLLCCAAAQPRVDPPVLGYVYDAGLHAVRPVRGIPGAALMGAPAARDLRLTMAAVSPRQNYALAISDEQRLMVIRWDGASSATAALPAALPGPDRIVFSPLGSVALIGDSRTAQLQVISGLPDSPEVRPVQLTWAADQALAVANDGLVAAASADGIRLAGPGLDFLIPLPGLAAALAFESAGESLLAALQSGEVYWIKNARTNPEVRRIYAGDDGTAEAAGVQFSSDRSTAFIADRNGVVTSIDLNTQAAAAVSCGCKPTGLNPIGNRDLYRLTEASSGPLVIFDATPSRYRFWFVPAEAQRSAQ